MTGDLAKISLTKGPKKSIEPVTPLAETCKHTFFRSTNQSFWYFPVGLKKNIVVIVSLNMSARESSETFILCLTCIDEMGSAPESVSASWRQSLAIDGLMSSYGDRQPWDPVRLYPYNENEISFEWTLHNLNDSYKGKRWLSMTNRLVIPKSKTSKEYFRQRYAFRQ